MERPKLRAKKQIRYSESKQTLTTRKKELSHEKMYSLGSLTAVITRRKPFEMVPHESVTYFSVTKFVRV